MGLSSFRLLMSSHAKPAAPAMTYSAAAVGWAVLAVGIFTLIFTSGKLAGGQVPALQIMAMRYLGAFLMLAIWWLARGAQVASLRTQRPGRHVLRAFTGAAGTTAAMYAATHLPLASASALGLLDGLFTLALAVLLLHERPPLRLWLASLLCLAGALGVVVAQAGLPSAQGGSLAPVLVAVMGALFIACESLLLKTLSRSESSFTVLWYVNLIAAVLLLSVAALNWTPMSAGMTAAFLALGPLSLVAMLCNLRAFRLCDAAVIGPLRYTWIVFGLVFGWLLFGERPSAGALAGAAVVIAGGVWIARLRRPR
ncbi:Membrane protein [plant metagenome]|uniref:Membrane protein n=1 Tax=plant metagenome TaxID=1297885 RepID=A0A484RGP8_9ZZZZ